MVISQRQLVLQLVALHAVVPLTGTTACKVVPEHDTDTHDDDDAFNEDEFDSYYYTDKPIATCQAVYDYTGKNTSELTIKKGSRVTDK